METETPSDHVRVHLKIHGRVQGVYFRASTVTQAQHLGVTGWVRNRPDASLETVAEGSRAKIDEFIAWCRHGPSGAQVREFDISWQEPTGEFNGFHIRR